MLKKYILSVLIMFMTNFVYSQESLPNRQKVGLYAPNNVNINGIANEWNSYQAYSSATELFYLIANDDLNLYIVINVVQPFVIDRILNGGISINITKNKKQRGIQITYPNVGHSLNLGLTRKEFLSYRKSLSDSIKTVYNDAINKNCKFINVIGIDGVDTCLSIYNTTGIKACGSFDRKLTYTMELAIPVKDLQPYINDDLKFDYRITVNGIKSMKSSNGDFRVLSSTAGSSEQDLAIMKNFTDGMSAYVAQQSASTDFSGEYTLAKKP